MTWEEINRKRLPFIRFGESLFKGMYAELRKPFIASIQNMQTPEEITEAARSYQADEEVVKMSLMRFYIRTAIAFAREQIKSSHYNLELKQEDDWTPIVMEHVRTQTGNKIAEITLTTYNDIQRITKKAVEAGIDQGWGMDKIARQIAKDQGEIDIWKALRIARTEVVSANNLGVKIGADELPGNKVKVWISTIDQRTRPEHLEMEGVRVAYNEDFTVGGELLEYPGDPKGSAGNIINCRCGYEIIVE